MGIALLSVLLQACMYVVYLSSTKEQVGTSRHDQKLRAKATASACNFAVALGQKILNLFASDGRRSRRRRPSAASRHARPRARSLSPQRRSRAPCASFPLPPSLQERMNSHDGTGTAEPRRRECLGAPFKFERPRACMQSCSSRVRSGAHKWWARWPSLRGVDQLRARRRRGDVLG